MNDSKVNLKPLVNKINLPTVLKTALLPNTRSEVLFIATQVGEIFYLKDNQKVLFLDIRNQIIELGQQANGYDERGLLGLEFHPEFQTNGLFYIHYSLAGSQGPGAFGNQNMDLFPNPCNPKEIEWTNRETNYDHIDTVEEWQYQRESQPQKLRTLLNLRRPFMNHNGVNSLNFSLETNRLTLTTGDGGDGYDPFNLSQDNLEIAGKIIEIDLELNNFYNNQTIVSRFNELPIPVQSSLWMMAKGGRNYTGIVYLQLENKILKLVGNVGQDLVESIYAYTQNTQISVREIVEGYLLGQMNPNLDITNFGWRGWEGDLPTAIIENCPNQVNLKKTIAFYDETIKLSTKRIQPLTAYYHYEQRKNKFAGSALTGVNVYLGNEIPFLNQKVIFTDFSNTKTIVPKGVLAYTNINKGLLLNDYRVINVNDNPNQSEYYMTLGANKAKTKLYLGTYASSNVTSYNLGTIYEITP